MLEGWVWRLEAGGWRKQLNNSKVLPDQRPNKVKGKFAAMKSYQGLLLNQKQELQVLILQIFIDLDRG